jgi:transposase
MSEIPPNIDVVIGVDTHKSTHVAVAISALGARLGTMTIPASSKGYQVLHAWARSLGLIRAVGVEGTGYYGAALSRFLCEKKADYKHSTALSRARC